MLTNSWEVRFPSGRPTPALFPSPLGISVELSGDLGIDPRLRGQVLASGMDKEEAASLPKLPIISSSNHRISISGIYSFRMPSKISWSIFAKNFLISSFKTQHVLRL